MQPAKAHGSHPREQLHCLAKIPRSTPPITASPYRMGGSVITPDVGNATSRCAFGGLRLLQFDIGCKTQPGSTKSRAWLIANRRRERWASHGIKSIPLESPFAPDTISFVSEKTKFLSITLDAGQDPGGGIAVDGPAVAVPGLDVKPAARSGNGCSLTLAHVRRTATRSSRGSSSRCVRGKAASSNARTKSAAGRS